MAKTSVLLSQNHRFKTIEMDFDSRYTIKSALVNIKGPKDSNMKFFQLMYLHSTPTFLQLLSILYNGCLEYLEGVCDWNKYSWTKIYSPTKIVDFEKDHMGFYIHWCNGVCHSRDKECCKL